MTNRKDSLNTPVKDKYRRHQRKLDAAVEPMPNRQATTATTPPDHRDLWRRWKHTHTNHDIEELASTAAAVGATDLEARCLERLAVRRARGDWLADNRRPLPGGAYSNLRKA